MRIEFWLWRGGGEEERWARGWGEALGEQMGGWDVVWRVLLEDGVVRPWQQALQRGMERVLEWLPGWGAALYETSPLWSEKSPLSFLRTAYALPMLSSSLEVECPDVVVVFHPMALLPLLAIKREGKWGGLIVGAIADLGLHRAWLQPGVSRYVVVHDALEDALGEGGIAREKVRVMGVPWVSGGRGMGREEACVVLGLDISDRWGFVDLTGALDWEVVCFQLSLVPSYRWLVYAGEGEAAQKRLREIAHRTGLRARMLRAQTPWDTLWSAVDLCLGDASLGRLYRALRAGVPMLLWEARSREERVNGGFVCERGMGEWASESELAVQIADMSGRGRWEAMQKAMRQGFPVRTREEWVSLLAETAVNREKIAIRDRELLTDEIASLQRALPVGAEVILDPRRLLTDGKAQEIKQGGWYEDIGEQVEDLDAGSVGLGTVQEALASLILREKRWMQRFDQLQEEEERWAERVEMARAYGDGRLVEEATLQQERVSREKQPIEEALRRLRRDKMTILERVKPVEKQVTFEKAPSHGAERSPHLDIEALESKFREADVEGQLQALKQRMKIQKRDLTGLKDEDNE